MGPGEGETSTGSKQSRRRGRQDYPLRPLGPVGYHAEPTSRHEDWLLLRPGTSGAGIIVSLLYRPFVSPKPPLDIPCLGVVEGMG